jgi:hypothetical protein
MALNNSIAVYKNSTETINTKNIFENQTSLLHFYAKEFNHEIINELPQINLMDLKKFDQSKLMIENQWSSHPTIQQRTDFIQKMNIRTENKNTVLAINILHNFEKYSQVLSQKLLTLNGINYNELFISNEIFMENFEEKETEYKFPTIFNSYYNIKNPLLQNLNFVNSNGKDLQPENFFSNENVGFVFEKNSLENDLQTLELIRTKEIKLKTFDYDGRKYSANESHKVKVIAEKRLEELTSKIEKNDQEILSFLAQNSDGEIKIILQEKIEKYIEVDKNFEKYNQKFIEFVSYTSFMSVQLPFEEIRKKRFILLEREKVFKEMLKECSFKMSSTEEEKAIFQKYISAENKYFEHDKYIESEIKILSDVFDTFTTNLSRNYINSKKNLLDYEAEIFKKVKKN